MANRASTRSPKDLKQIVAESTEQPEMIENLSILRNLSSDDKTENAMLRSRIDEQSHLIMILKQRADDANQRCKTLERIKSELEDFRSNAKSQLEMEIKKCKMIDDRFRDLADNHQELIKFKDEYKFENEKLRRENAHLRDENERIFSASLSEKDATISELTSDVELHKARNFELDAACRELHEQLMEERRILHDQVKKTEELAEIRVNELEYKLKEASEKMREASAKMKQDSSQQDIQRTEMSTSIERLKIEKEDLLDLVMQRGKIIEEKVAEIKKQESKYEDLKRKLKDMEDKFDREAASVDINLQVIKLRKELLDSGSKYSELEEKFEAYKKHSSGLLQQERDLNAKLRHAVG